MIVVEAWLPLVLLPVPGEASFAPAVHAERQITASSLCCSDSKTCDCLTKTEPCHCDCEGCICSG